MPSRSCSSAWISSVPDRGVAAVRPNVVEADARLRGRIQCRGDARVPQGMTPDVEADRLPHNRGQRDQFLFPSARALDPGVARARVPPLIQTTAAASLASPSKGPRRPTVPL